MNQPKLYANYNRQQRLDTSFVLNEYLHLIKWNPKGGDVIMDIGCGTGDITSSVLLPLLPKNIKKIIGVDISENMINYARDYSAVSQVEFSLADISSEKLQLDWYGSVDHLFSFYCLHWIENQRQAFKNMFNLLTPRGDVLLLILGYHPVFDVYENMKKTTRWRKYMLDVPEYIRIYRQWTNKENVKKILNEVGFSTKICKYVDRYHIFKNEDDLKQSMKSVNSYISQIPKDLQEDYMNDVINEMKPYIFIEGNNLPETSRVILPCKLIIVCASKTC